MIYILEKNIGAPTLYFGIAPGYFLRIEINILIYFFGGFIYTNYFIKQFIYYKVLHYNI